MEPTPSGINVYFLPIHAMDRQTRAFEMQPGIVELMPD